MWELIVGLPLLVFIMSVSLVVMAPSTATITTLIAGTYFLFRSSSCIMTLQAITRRIMYYYISYSSSNRLMIVELPCCDSPFQKLELKSTKEGRSGFSFGLYELK